MKYEEFLFVYLLVCLMEKVLLAAKQLLENSIVQSWSPLSTIKRVYFGDPIMIPLSSLPALIVRPKSTQYTPRWSQYDQKQYNFEILLVYNQSSYYWSYKWSELNISSASWLAWIATITTSTTHDIFVWSDVTILSIDPTAYNWTYKVTGVPSSTSFEIAIATNPWSYVSWWKARKDDVTTVFAVKDSITKVENNDALPSFETEQYTVTWTIQKNPTLPYNDGLNTYATAVFASVRSVDYVFSNNRWFPAYEVIVTADATVVDNR